MTLHYGSMTTASEAVPPRRIQRNVLAASERRLLDWLCARLPQWVTPDQLTVLAMVATVAIGLGYALSTFDPAWLGLSIGAFFVHWFGDSLDGSIARYRHIERPRYGYLVDHSSDAIGALVMFGGIGLSPYVRFDVALFVVVAYLLLAVHTFLMAKAAGDFPLSHLGAGPTELRVIMIALTIGMWTLGPDYVQTDGYGLFDFLFGGAACLMIAIFVVQTLIAARKLEAKDIEERKARDQAIR
ncbi:CDP-alcohol phosphatidyltransferase family protein [Tsuneonella mangrovi]|uniref:CDP-alcohol phosphatidyltransferase family protein n=1 Tax=Tsuneonella mangrovi TaxID=1982042 RepID=UPI001F0B6AD5|nr:CDP-alcohol phosphatidyltransferase family protein [Tsuneonella mangrovi]